MTMLKIAPTLDLPLEVVTEATAIVATRGAGKSSASVVVVEEAHREGVQCVVFDRTGVYWGLRSDKTGTKGGLSFYVLGGPHGDVPLEPHAGALIADLVVDSGHSFVLDLSDLSKAGAIRFAADFLERLYDRKARSRTTLLLVMDEAHFYFPQTPRGGFKGDSARLMGAGEDVVGLGRSRGLGVILTTQRTQSLNKAVLDLIETLIVMRMLSSRARQAVRDWIQEKHEDDDQGVIASLNSLPTGTAWVWSPLRGILQKVAIRRIRTFDSYATPEPGQPAVEPAVRKDVDLAALGAEMEATAERAKENDPAELKKRLRDLEAQLAERPLEQTARPIPNSDDLPAWSTYLRQQGWLNPDDEDFAERVAELVPVATISDLDAVWKVLTAAKDANDEFVRAFTSVAQPLAEAIHKAAEIGQRERTALTPPPPPPPPPPPAPARVTTLVPARTVEGLTRVQQKIIDSVAWWAAVGMRNPTRLQVAVMVGYSNPKSRGFIDALYGLNSAGLTVAENGSVVLTDAGSAAAAAPTTTPTEAEYQEQMFSLLGPVHVRILRALIALRGQPVARDELAEQVGYSNPKSRGFIDPLYRLRNLGLVDYSSGGVYATGMCFLG